MERSTRVNGILREMLEMERADKFGQMDHFMMVTGEMIRPMAEVDSFMLMEMFMRVIGRMIKLMDLESIITQTVLATKAIGKKTNNMVMGKRLGLMEHVMKENTRRVKKMDLVNFHGLMGQHIKANFTITILKVKESILGQIIGSIMVSGLITRCMVEVYLHGQMGVSM